MSKCPQVMYRYLQCDRCLHNYGGSACCGCTSTTVASHFCKKPKEEHVGPFHWGDTFLKLLKELKAAGYEVQSEVSTDYGFDPLCPTTCQIPGPTKLTIKLEASGYSSTTFDEERPSLPETIEALKMARQLIPNDRSKRPYLEQAIRFLEELKERGA